MRIRRTVTAIALTGGMLAGPAALANGPDANGPAKYGLCTAYFSGQGGAHGNKNNAPPFRNLAAAAEASDQTIEEFCAAARPSGGKGGSGNSKAPTPGSKGR